MRSLAKRVAIVCILLTLWSAVAVVAHHHVNKTDAQKCSVCVSAHGSVAVSRIQTATPIFVQIAPLRFKSFSSEFRVVAFALSVRPPPQA
ncbi:MAG: hypothetical protein DMG90_20890 [Acidobacteria bacterium]|jgi:hypothetical protein|nr:MAG: hypothetical protein DMG90_20890 [Acidobacteriota bacterium]